jgi:endoglucanase
MASQRSVSLLALAAVLCLVDGARYVRPHNHTARMRSSAASVVEQHGFLSVQGNRIVDEAGAPVRLRGMSLFWSQWMPQYWNAATLNWLKDDWNMTMIRAAMGIESGGYLENPGAEKGRMEAVVDAAIAAGIYVVIDWHDHNAEQHVNQAKQFFSEMARKYGSHPNVMFELFNEPVHQSWSGTIKPYHEQVIPVIRQHSKNLIILGTRSWSQEVDEASRDPVRGENLAYTVHFYANTHKQGLRNKVSAALSNGVAIFATEWGTCDASGDGTLNFGETNAWLNFFAEHHISDANWAVSDKSEACSALRPGASGNGGWSEGQLTDSGRFVRASMRGDSGGPGPSPSGGCCRFGADCGDCGDDGAGWCHGSASNCATCTGSFDPSASAPQCFGGPPSGGPGGGCCKWGNDCGDCGDDGTGWCHQSSSNCAACAGNFDGGAPSPGCR